ncbi:MAG: vanadium-dependent haloperoxidase [Candidatus Acidiferrum sp.]
MKKTLHLASLFFAGVFIAVNPAAAQTVNPVVQWNRTLLTIVRTPGAQPATVHATRSFAILHAATYDAVNSIDQTHKPYLVQLPGVSPQASQDAAVDAAAHEILVKLYPNFQTTLDSQFQQLLAGIADSQGKIEGIDIGQTVADDILAIRNHDGSDVTPPPFVPVNVPGSYQLTPPNFKPAQFTHWPRVTPFAIDFANQFRPGPPPALTSDTYADSFNEIKSIGILNGTTATPDQKQIGLFWNGAIQNYWNEIAQTLSIDHGLTTAQNARLFALLDLSLADTVIAFYDAKYNFHFWRPVTAIRAADTDNNPQTLADPNWLPQSTNTAPDPSYPGAHASISHAAATVLISFFDSNRFDQQVTSETLPGVVRSFKTISDIAAEATVSRVLAGQHFRFDENAGQRLGDQLGDFVFDNFLLRRHNADDGEHE